jgi:LysM repeat protein
LRKPDLFLKSDLKDYQRMRHQARFAPKTNNPTPTETAIVDTLTAASPAATATELTELQDMAETPIPRETPAAAGINTYTVRQGETLVNIAERYGVGLPTLAALNPRVTPEFLNVGDQISIPA